MHLSHLIIFSKLTFSKISFSSTIRVSNSLDLDLARHFDFNFCLGMRKSVFEVCDQVLSLKLLGRLKCGVPYVKGKRKNSTVNL